MNGTGTVRVSTPKGSTVADLENIFTYHSPKPGQPEQYETIRAVAKDFAYLIQSVVPESREQSLALTKLDETVMWANAGVARHG